MTNTLTLEQLFDSLDESGTGRGSEEAKEALQYEFDSGTILGDYKFEHVDGYTGCEGGGENIDFLCKVTQVSTGEELFFAVGGYYSSYGGDEIYWSEASRVTPVVEEVTIIRTSYKDDKGTVQYTMQKDKE